MGRAATAGAAYFAVVFSAGFALGALRVLALEPRLGPVGAVVLELPVMLAISFAAAAFLARRFAIPPAAGPRLAMGGVAFALLMVAEAIVGTALFGRTLAQHIAGYAEARALLGLAAQVAFALAPLVVARGPSVRSGAR